MPRKNKRTEKMRPEEQRFWAERKENEEAADQRSSDKRDRREPRKEYK